MSINIKVLNLGLRIVNLATRFLLVFILAKKLSPSDLGLYSLITVTISYSLYFVGLDFYIYTTREIINSNKKKLGLIIKNQFYLICLLYLFFIPLSYGLFFYQLLPVEYHLIFLMLVFLEHLNQEIYRLIIAFGKPFLANVLMFVRTGLWVLIITLFFYIEEGSKDVFIVLYMWCLGGILSLVLGGFYIKKHILSAIRARFDLQWIMKGLKVTLPFLIATIALRGIFTFDRYFIDILGNRELIASYALFSGISLALIAFLDAGVFSFSYPKLIKFKMESNSNEFKNEVLTMFKHTLFIVVMFILITVLTISIILNWIGQQVYYENISMFYWLLFLSVLYGLSMLPHYILYAFSKDRLIIISHIVTFCVFLGVVFVSKYSLGHISVLLALCVSMFVLMIVKMIAVVLNIPNEWYYFEKKLHG